MKTLLPSHGWHCLHQGEVGITVTGGDFPDTSPSHVVIPPYVCSVDQASEKAAALRCSAQRTVRSTAPKRKIRGVGARKLDE